MTTKTNKTNRKVEVEVVEETKVDKAKAKATDKAQAKAKAETTKPKTEVARDKWGCKEGSQAAAINATLGPKPVDVETIAKKTNLNAGRIRAHLKFLVEKEVVVATDDGWKVAK